MDKSHITFEDFILHVFNHSVAEPNWFFDSEEEYIEISDELLVHHLCKLFKSPSEYLARYSNDQIGQGLTYLFNASCSNFSHQIIRCENKTLTTEFIATIPNLYTNLLEQRCEPILSHTNTNKVPNLLNTTCYMLWDSTPLLLWYDDKERQVLICEKLAEILNSKNIACVESALHGLGHLQMYNKKLVSEVIDRFLNSTTIINESLIAYANNAKSGYIN